MKIISRFLFLLIAMIIMVADFDSVQAAEKLTAAQVGELGQPAGQIAFIRNKNIWVMDARGQNQRMICEIGNAEGRLSWGPDGRHIVFTRAGKVNFQSPDNTGGQHKIYDLFLAFLDSADVGKTYWWNRITDELGGRLPEWMPDGRIIFTKDMNANQVDAILPNYQICILEPYTGELQILRKDWQNMAEFLVGPSMNKNGDIAFTHFYDPSGKEAPQPQGIGIVNIKNIMTSMDTIRTQTSKMNRCISPVWSPDGKWLAFVSNNLDNPGVFITTKDMKNRYLVFASPPGTYISTLAPSFSPNSKWMTFATTDGSVWICDISGTSPKRISGPGLDAAPAWWQGSK